MVSFFCTALFFTIPNTGHASSLTSFLWGSAPTNNLQVGSAFNHLFNKSYPTLMWRPNIGITYHSINAVFFRSCDNDNAFGVGIQRTLRDYHHNNNDLSLGYKAGLTYGGWCYTGKNSSTASKPGCQGKVPLMPIAQIFLDYRYKNIGIELTEVRDIITVSLLFQFDSTYPSI